MTPVPRPIVVATAAPITPSLGNGPRPKMKHGPSKMLMVFASQRTRIAMAASPAPRKMALMRNNNRIDAFLPARPLVQRLLDCVHQCDGQPWPSLLYPDRWLP